MKEKYRTAQKMIDDLSKQIDVELEKIFSELEGQRISGIRTLILGNTFDFNSTKRGLVKILEDKLSSKINEQHLNN